MNFHCVDIVPRGITLAELGPDDCRYPYGDREITFCGHPRREKSSYCAHHHAICWTKPLPRRDKYIAGASR